MEQLDQLHVVSDIHLGGAPGHQIFNQGPLLAATIDELRARPRDLRIGLVINGDIIDFLAAPDAVYFDPKGAVGKLEAVLRDPAFRPVFEALARFVANDRRVLALVLGNHDVELALPDVQERLLQEICGDDAAARGRVRIAFDGTGYACAVGGQRALCLHGNDADPWNPVDQAALRQVILADKLGLDMPAWTPNAGTRLVIDIMNGIKKNFPLVDLLKPETKPVLSVLLAIDPRQLGAAKRFAGVATRFSLDDYRMQRGAFLGAEGTPAAAPPPRGDDDAALAALLDRKPKIQAKEAQGGDLLAEVEGLYREGRDPLNITPKDAKLGFGGIVWDALFGKDPRRELRESLAGWLKDDKTFALDTPDSTFTQLDKLVGPDVHYLIAGHTHLARAIPRAKGGGFYFNSGTWIRLIRLTEDLLGDDDAFAAVFDAFKAGTMAALDEAEALVLRDPTLVSIEATGGVVVAELRRPEIADDGSLTLTPKPGTRFQSSRRA